MHNKSKVWQIIREPFFSRNIFRCTLYVHFFLSLSFAISIYRPECVILNNYYTDCYLLQNIWRTHYFLWLSVSYTLFLLYETDMHWLYIFIKIFHTNSARKLKLVWITSNVNYGVCVCAVCFYLNRITFHATIHRQSIYN